MKILNIHLFTVQQIFPIKMPQAKFEYKSFNKGAFFSARVFSSVPKRMLQAPCSIEIQLQGLST